MLQTQLKNILAPTKKLLRVIIIIISFSILLPFPSRSQTKYINSHASFAEKIYLQLDSKVYTTDQNIWFKAIVTDAIYHAPTIYSGVLYVELIGPNEKIIEKKLIKVENGIGDGFFKLNNSYKEGMYLISAYTEWDKNFGSDFFFKEYIQVFALASKAKADPIKNVVLIEGQNRGRRLNATFDPFAIDSLHKGGLTLFLSIDEKKDTLAIKKSGDNTFSIDKVLPDDCQFVTLQIQTKNHFNYSKSIILNKDYLDLQFFPESGELVHGIPCLMGFKALDCNGKGKTVEGEIVNGQGEVISTFKSNQLGMGSFLLTHVDSSMKYFARLLPNLEKGLQKIHSLPEVTPKGNVLSLRKVGEEISLKAISNYLKNDTISIQVSCRGVVYSELKGLLMADSLKFSLPVNTLPEGIIACRMMANSIGAVAERLYFNERAETRINMALSTDKESYTQRERTKLTIQTTDNERKPVNANLSVIVLNKDQKGKMQDTRQNILSYFLLSSELKGEIENPGFYFSKNENRFNDLDALLMTQGWRRYNYTKPVSSVQFRREKTLTVSGSVSGLIAQKKSKKDVGLTMMTLGKTRSVQSQTTDSLGRFCFNLDDQYGQNLNVFIQSTNKKGVKKDYTITLDKKESPVVSFNHFRTMEKPDSLVRAFVNKNIERDTIEDLFPVSKGNIQLKEVVVEAYRMTPERAKVMEKYGKPDMVIDGKAIREKEEKWSYGLYSVLMFNFPGKLIVNRVPLDAPDDIAGILYAHTTNGLPTFVVIDGIPVKPYDYGLIPGIPPSEVSSFEIIENAENFRSLFCELYPDWCIDGPRSGNVIAIYTYGKKGIWGVNRNVGVINASVPVFSEPCEFYTPKYEHLKPEDWYKPDLRALIHWEPKLRVDSLGKAFTTFYNADNLGKMQVVVEAISEKGELGYQELFYDVKKRK